MIEVLTMTESFLVCLLAISLIRTVCRSLMPICLCHKATFLATEKVITVLAFHWLFFTDLLEQVSVAMMNVDNPILLYFTCHYPTPAV